MFHKVDKKWYFFKFGAASQDPYIIQYFKEPELYRTWFEKLVGDKERKNLLVKVHHGENIYRGSDRDKAEKVASDFMKAYPKVDNFVENEDN